jgi:RNA polymerase sigma factor (sigma-70 family)
MGMGQRSGILHTIRKIAGGLSDKQTSDKALLLRFVEKRDEGAFTALVRRHDLMVMGVALRLLRHHQDAEDVCQATFLLLAKKASTAAWRDSVANWLYEVAHRLSLKARQAAARRSAHEGKVLPKTPPDALAEISARDLQRILDEELSRVPERYRSPLILCCLEGRTRDETARFLGIPLSTVISRLEEGREVLRRRLAGRGVPLSLALVGVTLQSEMARAALSATMARALSQVARQALAGKAMTNVVSANVVALINGGMKAMFVIKLKAVSAALVVAGLLVGGLLAAGLPTLELQGGGEKKDPPPAKSPSDAKDAKPAGQDSTKVVNADDIVKDGKLVASLAFCNNGKTVAVVVWKERPPQENPWPQDTAVVLWDVEKGKVQRTLEKIGEGKLWFNLVTASRDGKRIAASAQELGAFKVGHIGIKVWDAQTGDLVQTVQTETALPYCVLSPDGKRLACTGNSASHGVFMWDVDTGKPLKTLEAPEGVHCWSVAFSGDGKHVAAGGHTYEDNKKIVNKTCVWETETGQLKHELSDSTMTHMVHALAFSPDGKTLAAGGSGDATIRVWNLETGKIEHLLNSHTVTGLAFSPDGTLVSAGYSDSKVLVWDVSNQQPRMTLEGHTKHRYKGRNEYYHHLNTLALAPDGRTAASGSNDGTMRVWQVTQPKKK